jgi:hypothetical protein
MIGHALERPERKKGSAPGNGIAVRLAGGAAADRPSRRFIAFSAATYAINMQKRRPAIASISGTGRTPIAIRIALTW